MPPGHAADDLQAQESLSTRPLNDPSNTQENGDWNEDDSATAQVDVKIKESTFSWQEQSQKEEDYSSSSLLDPIDHTDFAFSSQRSGEALRRQAVSPRKVKKQKDYSLGSTLAKPMFSFSEKLTAVMAMETETNVEKEMETKEIGKETDSTGGPRKIDFSGKEDDTVEEVLEGSDSGSEAEWNDDVTVPSILKALEQEQGQEEHQKNMEDIPSIHSDSDDGIPTLSRKSKIVLEESDSELEDDPFNSFSGAKSPSPSPIPTPSADTSISMGLDKGLCLSDSDDSLSDPSDSLSGLDDLLGKDKGLPDHKETRRGNVGIDTASTRRSTRISTRQVTQAAATSLSISPTRPAAKPVKAKKPSLFSLDTLLKEKERRVKSGYDLKAAQKQLVLDDELLEEYGEDEDEEAIFGPDAIPKGILSEEQQEALCEIIGEEGPQLVEDIAEFFLRWPQKTSLLGVDHQDLMRVLLMYGAKEEYLEQEWKVGPVTTETKTERVILQDTKRFPRQNLKAVTKLINMTATLDPRFYDTTEVRKIMNLLLRMTTDPIIGDVKSLLGSTMVALLDTIPAEAWETERHRLCDDILSTLGSSLAFVLLLLHQLPSLSLRMTLLRRGIALSYLGLPPIKAGEIAPDIEELHRALFVDRGFLINAETHYRDLGRRIQVFGFCLDDERMIASYGPSALEPLLRKLRMMHGKIIDVRAAFMERTLTKDLIQRLYMRLYYSGIHRQSTKQQTTLSFGKQNPENGKDPDQTGDKGTTTPLAVNIADLRLVPELASPGVP
ncbi:hypothetical protein BGX28_002560 [Mortierella sp. GBA30]|nr:hypothetical protein BGX28_002560 [Mortierella sp. GBA30]